MKKYKLTCSIIIALAFVSIGCLEEKSTTPLNPTLIKEYSEFSTAKEYVQWIYELDNNKTLTDYQKKKMIEDKIIGKYIQWECSVEDIHTGFPEIVLNCYAENPPKFYCFRSVFLEDFENINSDVLLSINKGNTLKFEGKVRSEWLGALYLEEWKILGITS